MRKIERLLSVMLVICIVLAYLPFNFLNDVNTSASSIIVTIDPGHGGNDPGTVGATDFGGHYESWYNLEISKAAKERLTQYGITVYMTRENDVPLTLSSRVEAAVQNKSDLLVSIHNNYSGNPSVSGMEICGPNKSYNLEMYKKSLSVGNDIIKHISENTALINRGYSTKDYPNSKYSDGSPADYYAINRYAKQMGLSASLIVECGFCSNKGDVDILENDSSRKKIGYSIADGIAEFYGISLPVKDNTETENDDNFSDNNDSKLYSAVALPIGAGGKIGFDLDCAVKKLDSLKENEEVFFRVTPDSGYRVVSIFVGDKSVKISGDSTKTAVYKFSMPNSDVKVSASFEKADYLPGVYKIDISSLNVRVAPNANEGTEVLGALNAGDVVTVTGIENTHWGKFDFEGKVGYVSIHKKYATRISDIPKATAKPVVTSKPEKTPVQTSSSKPVATQSPHITSKPETEQKPINFKIIDKLSKGNITNKQFVYVHSDTVVSNVISDLSQLDDRKNIVVNSSDGGTVVGYSVLKTGMKIRVGNQQYEVVVYGDINGDGLVNIIDAYSVLNHIMGDEKLEGVYAEAGLLKESQSTDITIIELMSILNMIVE